MSHDAAETHEKLRDLANSLRAVLAEIEEIERANGPPAGAAASGETASGSGAPDGGVNRPPNLAELAAAAGAPGGMPVILAPWAAWNAFFGAAPMWAAWAQLAGWTPPPGWALPPWHRAPESGAHPSAGAGPEPENAAPRGGNWAWRFGDPDRERADDDPAPDEEIDGS